MRTSLDGLAGRVALITGAGRNLGRQVALTLADAGANVAINVKQNEPEARAVAEAACQLGVQAVTVIGDVSDPDVDAALVERVEDQLGPIDVLVHCVGIRPLRRVVETSIDEWHEVLETNCSSYFYLVRLLLPSMAERGFGRLIAITGPDANRRPRGAWLGGCVEGGSGRMDQGDRHGVRIFWDNGEHGESHHHGGDGGGTP